MYVGDLIHEGNDEVETWLKLALELLETVNHACILLTNDYEADDLGVGTGETVA